MRTTVRPSRVHLPKRIRLGEILATFDDIKESLAVVASLADRVGSLPGISCLESSSHGNSPLRHYYLDSAFLQDVPASEYVLFATLHPDGRLLLRVPRPELEEVLRSGWGELRGDRIHTFAPRDIGDLTVLWRVVLMAYFDVVERGDTVAWSAMRPRFPADGLNETRSRVIAPGTFF